MEYGLEQEDIKRIHEAFATNPGVEKVILFGSRAMGHFKSGSDIDLAVVGNELTFNDILELHAQLENLGLLYKFDLQLFSAIKDADVLAHIERVGKVIYPSS